MSSQMIPESILSISIAYLSLAPVVKPEKVMISFKRRKGLKCSGTFEHRYGKLILYDLEIVTKMKALRLTKV